MNIYIDDFRNVFHKENITFISLHLTFTGITFLISLIALRKYSCTYNYSKKNNICIIHIFTLYIMFKLIYVCNIHNYMWKKDFFNTY